MDEDVWHVLEFWTVWVSIKKGPKVIVNSVFAQDDDDEDEGSSELFSYDFSEVFVANKVDERSPEALLLDEPPTLEYTQLPTKHLHDVPAQFYETVRAVKRAAADRRRVRVRVRRT